MAPLQVAVARLLGYRWPAELDDKMRLSKRARALVNRCDELAKFADDDGLVCIPSVRGEEPAADRLLALLATAGIKPPKVRELAGGADLDEWLRNNFFEEHCELFHDRPFVWHIWDGRKRDGFHALVNYHGLCEGKGKGRKRLESLTYAYLGEWITRQKDGVKRGEGGAEDRLAAALELQNRLKLILEGEPPFDIFVRWKPLAEQSIGWEPDINDGVRMSIRPFLEPVRLTVCQRNIHCGHPWVEFGAGTDGSELPSPRGGIALPACCLWISPSTLIQNFARSLCPPSAAARALFRATLAASAPCTSIMSRASDGSSAPSVMTVASSIAASGEAALFPGEFNGTLEA